ncbi:MAG: response regulator transcription factor [Clostridiales bacterium]|nr:response regulator transcription factor [Clostridiales bacterium]
MTVSLKLSIEKKPNLVLLDIMLPGEDGLEILKKLRRDPAAADIPVIMETARGTEYDRIVGLDAGADGYLAKPFGMLEMVSHVRTILRRTSGKRNGSLCLGGLRLDQQEHTVYAGEREVLLSLKEYELLKLFMSCPRKVVYQKSAPRPGVGIRSFGKHKDGGRARRNASHKAR